MDKEILQGRAQLVRIHEANCQIEHPSPEELNFRLAIMKRLGTEYQLRELRSSVITGPGRQPQPTTAPAAKK
jgi:hypothetical protein